MKLKDNIPFSFGEAGLSVGAFVLTSGILNLYYTQRDDKGRPCGKRHFLFQITEGQMVFAIPDEPQAAIIAVPMRDSELTPTDEKICATWVEKSAEKLGYSRFKQEELLEKLDEESFAGFNKGLLAELTAFFAQDNARGVERNQRRYKNEDVFFQDSIDLLSHIADKTLPSEPVITEVALVKACAAVAESQKMRLVLNENIRNGVFSADAIGDIAAASHFRTREVVLTEDWHKESGGSLLAWWEGESGREKIPVALLQTSGAQYIMYNPADESRVPVTADMAEKIAGRAVMFYRTLPTKPLVRKDIIDFVKEGTNPSDWAYVLILGIAGGLLAMLMPEITGKVFDTVIPNGDKSMLWQIGFLMAAVALTNFTFSLTRSFAMQRISAAMEKDLQSAVWDRLLSLPATFFRDYSAGELAERAMGISKIREMLSNTVVSTVITGIFSCFYIILLFAKGKKLAWWGLLVVAITLLISVIFIKLQTKYESEQLDLRNDMSGKMFGWLSGLAKIKLSSSEKRVFHNWSVMFYKSRKLTLRSEGIGNYSAVVNSALPLLSSLLIYASFLKQKEEAMAVGAFIAFTAALGKLMESSVQLSNTAMEINVIGPLYKKLAPILEAIPEYDEGKGDPGELVGNIELSHINFRYSPDGPLVIRDLSLKIQAGEHVALVGPSGSGKSTLFRILLAFEKPENGEIYFDGTGLSQLDIRLVRKQLGVVLQSGQLLAGTIFENISGNNPEITQEAAMRAIRMAGMEDDLKDMPMGLHTVISEAGGTLSGGQRQRLLIARALASNPKILFFDEATSALDNKTQKIVSDSINNLKATRITIAHRLSTIQDCDRIVVLEGGVITEMGDYEELMALGGTFAEMARRQIV